FNCMANEDKPLKVMCPRPNCEGIVAHIYGEKMVSIKRSKNIIQNLGEDWNMIVTCPFKDCPTRTSIICEGGKIKLDNLKILKEEDNLDINKDKDGEEQDEPNSEAGEQE